ncbi:MAG TPA: glycine/sarcosine/betaine reductase selenoprotein B family protein [Candidatus Binataceae bacterium]|nr:glycine/sarcosine/betaine reductase selenoprotein B family protein [Candidatus Binataceae bacterium]
MRDDYVRYIERTREYYIAEGYKTPYKWAHFEDVPFTALKKPLAQCRVGLVTTSDIALKTESGEHESHDPAALAGNVYSIPFDTPPERLYSRNEHYDRYATTLDDVNAYCPVVRLRELAAQGRIGSVAARFHGVYTSYSQRVTMERDAPEVLRRCREDGVDVVLLTPV